MPVDISARPLPSRSTRPVIWVSLVLRSTVTTRTAYLLECRACGGVLVSISAGSRHYRRRCGAPLAARVGLAYISGSRVLAARNIGSLKRRMDHSDKTVWHGTTILCLRKGGQVVVAGDGQGSMGQTIVKSNARKLRRLAGALAPREGPRRPPRCGGALR